MNYVIVNFRFYFSFSHSNLYAALMSKLAMTRQPVSGFLVSSFAFPLTLKMDINYYGLYFTKILIDIFKFNFWCYKGYSWHIKIIRAEYMLRYITIDICKSFIMLYKLLTASLPRSMADCYTLSPDIGSSHTMEGC